MVGICESYNPKSLIKQPICFQDPRNASDKLTPIFIFQFLCRNLTIWFPYDDSFCYEVALHTATTTNNDLQRSQKIVTRKFLIFCCSSFLKKIPSKENGGIKFFLNTCPKILNIMRLTRKGTYQAIRNLLWTNTSQKDYKEIKVRKEVLKNR